MRAGLLALPLPSLPGWARAYPVDEVVQGAYLTLAPGQVRLELDVAPGAEVAGAVLPALDADRAASEAEARAYVEAVLSASLILLDGEPAAWDLVTVAPPDLGVAAEGAAAIRIEAVVPRLEREEARSLVYENRDEPATSIRIANVFLSPGDGWTWKVAGQGRDDRGQRLAVICEAQAQ